MILDHIVQVYYPSIERFNFIGRLAFPLFAWGIAKGFSRTKNYNLYLFRLLTVAVISQVPYSLLFGLNYLNVCFTLLIGLLGLKVYESDLSKTIKCTIMIIFAIISEVLSFEYGIYGIFIIMTFI